MSRSMGRPGAVFNGSEWARSSFCQSGSCVEVRISRESGTVQLRDSKVAGGPVLTFDSGEWQAFVAGVRNEEFEA